MDIEEEDLKEQVRAGRLDNIVRSMLNVLSSRSDFTITPGVLKRVFRELWGWGIFIVPPERVEDVQDFLREQNQDEVSEALAEIDEVFDMNDD